MMIFLCLILVVTLIKMMYFGVDLAYFNNSVFQKLLVTHVLGDSLCQMTNFINPKERLLADVICVRHSSDGSSYI